MTDKELLDLAAKAHGGLGANEFAALAQEPSIQQLMDELSDLKECHQNLLESDNSNIQQLIAEIYAVETWPDTDTNTTICYWLEIKSILDKWRMK